MAFKWSLMLSVINEQQMEYETDRVTFIKRCFLRVKWGRAWKVFSSLSLGSWKTLRSIFTYFRGNLGACLDFFDTKYEMKHFLSTFLLFLIQDSMIWPQKSSSNFPFSPLGRKNNFKNLKNWWKKEESSLSHAMFLNHENELVTSWISAWEGRHIFTAEAYHQ